MALASLGNSAGIADMAKNTLAVARRGLSSDSAGDRPWPLLPLIVCQAICGRYEHAVPIAACLQLLMAAGDTFDDIEDKDSPESLCAICGNAKAINTATALLILAERKITRLKEKGIDAESAIRIMEMVNTSYTTACAGQHLDLSLNMDCPVSEEVYLKIISMKSASQIECACRVGAVLATENEELISLFSTFGHNLGMASQIINDITGIISEADLAKPKLTLPVVYALANTKGKTRQQLENTFRKKEAARLEITAIKDVLYNCGAVHYAVIKAELYKQDAINALNKAQKMKADTNRLKVFLE